MPSYAKSVKIPGKSAQELYDFVNREIDHWIDKVTFTTFELKRNEAAKCIEVSSKMFSAKLVCSEGELNLNGSLSLFALPFRSKIDQSIDTWLDQKFNVGKK